VFVFLFVSFVGENFLRVVVGFKQAKRQVKVVILKKKSIAS
jgi:hypothetical protein